MNGQWLWLSWYSRCFWQQRSEAWIQSSASFKYTVKCIEKTRINKGQRGREWPNFNKMTATFTFLDQKCVWLLLYCGVVVVVVMLTLNRSALDLQRGLSSDDGDVGAARYVVTVNKIEQFTRWTFSNCDSILFIKLKRQIAGSQQCDLSHCDQMIE